MLSAAIFSGLRKSPFLTEGWPLIQKEKGNIFSSPEHEVLMVSYCDQSLSVVCALSTFCFKQLLLQNRLTDFEIILQEGSLGDPFPKLHKPFRSIEQGGPQS